MDAGDRVGGAVHGRARQPRGERCAAHDPSRSRSSDPVAGVDRQRLRARLRRAAAHGRHARRSLRAQAHVPRGDVGLHRGLRRRGARAEHGAARRRACRPGRWRGARDASDAHAACGGVPGRSAGDRDRRVVGDQRDRGRDRPARRGRRRAGHLLALDLLDQRPHRPCPDPAVGAAARREPRPLRPPGPPGPRDGVRRRVREPMLPMSFFAKRSFAVTNVVSLSMYFGMFGSIFFLSQYMQNVLHNTPLQAGLKLLVWTGASMVVAPLAGVFSERFGSRLFMVAGLSLQAAGLGWLASMLSTHLAYSHMIIPFVMAGSGMALVFAPSANAVLASVTAQQAGQASGANNAIREIGGVLGVAVLASVFTGNGGYNSPDAVVAGLMPAMWVGVAVLAGGALVALALPFGKPAVEQLPEEQPLRAHQQPDPAPRRPRSLTREAA